MLDENTATRMMRVFKRWINQKNGKESYYSKPTLKFLWWNIKWVFEFNIKKKVISGIAYLWRESKNI